MRGWGCLAIVWCLINPLLNQLAMLLKIFYHPRPQFKSDLFIHDNYFDFLWFWFFSASLDSLSNGDVSISGDATLKCAQCTATFLDLKAYKSHLKCHIDTSGPGKHRYTHARTPLKTTSSVTETLQVYFQNYTKSPFVFIVFQIHCLPLLNHFCYLVV